MTCFEPVKHPEHRTSRPCIGFGSGFSRPAPLMMKFSPRWAGTPVYQHPQVISGVGPLTTTAHMAVVPDGTQSDAPVLRCAHWQSFKRNIGDAQYPLVGLVAGSLLQVCELGPCHQHVLSFVRQGSGGGMATRRECSQPGNPCQQECHMLPQNS
jgi:hypothetical protein